MVLYTFIFFADHRATVFTLSTTFETAQKKSCAAYLPIFVMKLGARTIKHIFRFVRYLSTFFYAYLPINIHFQFIIITNISFKWTQVTRQFNFASIQVSRGNR